MTCSKHWRANTKTQQSCQFHFSFPTRDAQYFDQAHARDLGYLLQTLKGLGRITGNKLAIQRESG
jgi:hypothetical protein